MKRLALLFACSLMLLASCNRHEFPGFTKVAATSSGDTLFIDSSSAKWHGYTLTFRQLTEEQDGTYVIQTGATDCQQDGILNDGTRYSKDGQVLGTVKGRSLLVADKSAITDVADKACQIAVRGFDGEFNGPKAMQLLFGRYDERRGASAWIAKRVPEDKVPIKNAQEVESVPIASFSYSEKGVDKRVLVIETHGSDSRQVGPNACTRCAVGAFFFSRSNTGWLLEAGNPFVVGAWQSEFIFDRLLKTKTSVGGQPTRLLAVGPNRHGASVTILTEKMHGYDISEAEYWLVPYGTDVLNTFALDRGLELNESMTGIGTRKTVETRILPNTGEYADIELASTKENYSDGKWTPVNRQLSVLSFRDGRYVPR